MGHKVSPIAFRIGYIKSWRSTGYADRKNYGAKVSFDVQVRIFIQKALMGMPIGGVYLNHEDGIVKAIIYTSKVSIVMGKDEENVAKLVASLEKRFGSKFAIEVREVKKPELSAAIVADSIARQIERKLPYRRVIKMAVARSMEKGALGIKVIVSGRLNGIDIARTETYKDGNIPTQTIRADIDYIHEPCHTASGAIGVKVWIYKGDVLRTDNK